MTDKQKIQLLTAALIYNQATLWFVFTVFTNDIKRRKAKEIEVWDLVESLMETANLEDEKVQAWAFKHEFASITDATLKDLRSKKWWQL